MIYPALKIIVDRLNRSIHDKWGESVNGTAEIVQLNNIANISEDKNDLQNKIIITLIKIEEEATLKNAAFYSKALNREKDKKVNKFNPPIYLNLYLLVSVTKKSYIESLQLLSDTIIYFQSHKNFQVGEGEQLQQKVTLELHDIGFQEAFDMWSSLGSKQLPSVLYKLRLLEFFDPNETTQVPVVRTVTGTFGEIESPDQDGVLQRSAESIESVPFREDGK